MLGREVGKLRDVTAGYIRKRRQAPPLARHREPSPAVNKDTALGTGPTGKSSVAGPALHRQTAILERLRMDRQLEEALAPGSNPLRLAEDFGLSVQRALVSALPEPREKICVRAEQQALGRVS